MDLHRAPVGTSRIGVAGIDRHVVRVLSLLDGSDRSAQLGIRHRGLYRHPLLSPLGEYLGRLPRLHEWRGREREDRPSAAARHGAFPAPDGADLWLRISPRG